MDTLSRDSNSSGGILPLVGVIAGALGLILAIVALVKLSTLQKTVAAHDVEVLRISSIEGEVRSASAATAKIDGEMKALREGVQNALNQVGEQLGAINGKITKIEEAQKARPAAAAGKPGSAPVATGVLNSDGTYSIAPGDNLSKIARKFGVRVDSIEAENPGLEARNLKVGQKIRMPKR